MVRESRPEWIVAFVAIISIGAAAVLVDERNSATIGYSLGVSRCRVAIGADDAPPSVVSERNDIICIIQIDRAIGALFLFPYIHRLEHLLDAAKSVGYSHDVLSVLWPYGEAIIVFTSEATSAPKGRSRTNCMSINSIY